MHKVTLTGYVGLVLQIQSTSVCHRQMSPSLILLSIIYSLCVIELNNNFAGLGYEVTKYLALLGARVIIACESESKAKAVSDAATCCLSARL